MLEIPQTRPGSSMSGWIKKASPLIPSKETEAVIQKLTNEYDMDCPDSSQEVSTNSLHAYGGPQKDNKLEFLENNLLTAKQHSCFKLHE